MVYPDNKIVVQERVGILPDQIGEEQSVRQDFCILQEIFMLREKTEIKEKTRWNIWGIGIYTGYKKPVIIKEVIT